MDIEPEKIADCLDVEFYRRFREICLSECYKSEQGCKVPKIEDFMLKIGEARAHASPTLSDDYKTCGRYMRALRVNLLAPYWSPC